jgi:nucleoside-diphosphate-sugar epimerase
VSILVIFGLGYSARRIAAVALARGWEVVATRQTADEEALAFGDEAAVRAALRRASHILSSVPPDAEGDPVLRLYRDVIAAAPACWCGYLSSTGVYGDCGGGWVDEAGPTSGRRMARVAADAAWQHLRDDVRIFRLPGIYGPGRSTLDRVRAGWAMRIDLPGHVFSRVHVDDIAAGVSASWDNGPAGIYNLADDHPASQNAVVEGACALLGTPVPPLVPLDEAGLSPQARAFYEESRRVANGRAKRLLGWRPAYPDWRAGLRAIAAAEGLTTP